MSGRFSAGLALALKISDKLRPLIVRGEANLTQPAGQLLSLPSGLAMAQLYNNGITDCLHTLTSAGRMEKPFAGLMSFKDCRWA